MFFFFFRMCLCLLIHSDSLCATFPVSCFIYRYEEVKPSEKWLTYIKIKLNQRFLDLRNRFHIDGI